MEHQKSQDHRFQFFGIPVFGQSACSEAVWSEDLGWLYGSLMEMLPPRALSYGSRAMKAREAVEPSSYPRAWGWRLCLGVSPAGRE